MCLCKLFVFVNSLLVASGSVVYPCLTPNGESAVCISLFSCPVLIKSLGTLNSSSISFIKQSICTTMSSEEFPVCCGSTGNFQTSHEYECQGSDESCKPSSPLPQPPTSSLQPPSSSPQSANKPSASSELAGSSNLSDSVTPSKLTEPVKPDVLEHRDFVKNQLLPTRKYCGLQHTDDRIYEENAIALDEYPWLVHLILVGHEIESPKHFDFRCNGILINRRYVLTSLSCGTYSISVRLGQYNTNQTVSCVDNPGFVECTEPWLIVEIEDRILRNDYTSNFTVHDFSLLRLAKNVTYTDYIRPVCLPLDQPKEPPEFYTFSGWGTPENIAGYKKRLRYKPTNLSECYALDMQDHQLGYTEDSLSKLPKYLISFCLLPKDENGELVCSGDRAAPIMYPRRFQWFVDGIITRIYRPSKHDYCSNKLPVAGLKITHDILDWMFDNIHP